MPITINILYKGKGGSAQSFAKEMTEKGFVEEIRKEEGNERYDYFLSMNNPETVLLIDVWRDQAALDVHHSSPVMGKISELREKYDLHMTVERFVTDESFNSSGDEKFIRK